MLSLLLLTEFGCYFFVAFRTDEVLEVDRFCVEVVHQDCLDFGFLWEFYIIDGNVMVFGFFFDLLLGFQDFFDYFLDVMTVEFAGHMFPEIDNPVVELFPILTYSPLPIILFVHILPKLPNINIMDIFLQQLP